MVAWRELGLELLTPVELAVLILREWCAYLVNKGVMTSAALLEWNHHYS